MLARMTACRSRGSACGLEGVREERTNKGLVEVLRTSMKTCGDCPRRPAAAALQSVLERASGVVFPGGRHLGFREGRRIDVSGWNGAQAAGIEALTRPAVPVAQEVSEGSVRRSHRQPTRLRCSSPPKARERRGGSQPARSRRRAVKHAAAGGRMTARWSGAAPGRSGRAVFAGGGLEVERWRVSHSARPESPEVVFVRGCS